MTAVSTKTFKFTQLSQAPDAAPSFQPVGPPRASLDKNIEIDQPNDCRLDQPLAQDGYSAALAGWSAGIGPPRRAPVVPCSRQMTIPGVPGLTPGPGLRAATRTPASITAPPANCRGDGRSPRNTALSVSDPITTAELEMHAVPAAAGRLPHRLLRQPPINL